MINYAGLAGSVAVIVGFNSGNKDSLNLPFSGTDNVTDLVTNSNFGSPGVWLYRVDQSEIICM